MTEPAAKKTITPEERSTALSVLKGLFHIVCALFGIFVGTAMLIDAVNNGFTWSNTPWLILSFWLLVRR